MHVLTDDSEYESVGEVSVKGQLDQISPQPKELHRLGQANEDVTVSRTISDHYVAATSCSYTI